MDSFTAANIHADEASRAAEKAGTVDLAKFSADVAAQLQLASQVPPMFHARPASSCSAPPVHWIRSGMAPGSWA